MKMIKIFNNFINAEKFAQSVKGKIESKYDWDGLKKKIIKEYMVKY